MDLFDTMTDANSLYEAFNKSKSESIWKESVQRYESNLLLNIYKTQKQLREETYSQKPFNTFILNERGHSRYIKSLHISDRVVQRALCDYILLPSLRKHFIYDNGASMKGKGISFTRKRIKYHLRKFHRLYGNDGYIMLCDFSKFFDNIRHDKLKEYFFKYITDEKSQNLITHLIDSFKIDVSYLSENEYKNCYNKVFSLLEYNKIPDMIKTNQKFMYKSVGIGSQLSQISGIGFVTILDQFIKTRKQVKFYGRYMDDFYIIHKDKDFLKEIYSEIKNIIGNIGLFLNENKTRIISLSKEFTFLKCKYTINNYGKIHVRMNHGNVRRLVRKMRLLINLYKNGKRNLKELQNVYNSCIGTYKEFDTFYIRKNLKSIVNGIYFQKVNNLKGKLL